MLGKKTQRVAAIGGCLSILQTLTIVQPCAITNKFQLSTSQQSSKARFVKVTSRYQTEGNDSGVEKGNASIGYRAI